MSSPIDDRHTDLYVEALTALEEYGVEFMLGGAFAVYHYTGWWRNTHDMDIYVMPEDVPEVLQVLSHAGFIDQGEQAPGDMEWIRHTSKETISVDVIWRFANLSNFVCREWFERASQGQFLGVSTAFIPLEELVWVKLFVINRHRCDWPDLLRVLKAQCGNLNYWRLVEVLGEHWLLLAALITVFDWQYPNCMECIPDSLRDEFVRRYEIYREHPVNIDRENLLDPWLHLRADKYAIWRNE